MKKKNIYFLGIAILLSGCAENIADTDGKKGDENLNSQSTTTFVGGTEKTRTSLNMTYPGGTQVNYFWEPGDKIWTADGVSGEADITATAPTAKFKLPKIYTSSTLQCIIRAQMLRAIMELSSPNPNIKAGIIQHNC